MNPRVILERVHMRTGEPLDFDQLSEDLARVFGLDDFQRVTVDVESATRGDAVVLRVTEKSWGPTYIKFGLEAVDDLEGESAYALRASITRTRLNARGGEWRSEIQIGSEPRTFSEFFQPLDFGGRWFVAPWVESRRFKPRLFESGQPVAQYDARAAGGGIDVGVQFGRFGAMRVGVARTKVLADVGTGSSDLPTFDVDSGGIRFQLGISTLDRPAIATRGGSLTVLAYFPRKSLGSDEQYDRIQAVGSRIFGKGRHFGIVAAAVGANLGSTLPIYDEFEFGGLFSLGGFSEGEFRGQRLAGLSVGYYSRLATLPAGFGKGVYAGAIAEIGNAWAATSEISLSDTRHGFTAIAGLDTLVGPIFFAYGLGEGGRSRFYLTVGRSF